MILKQLISLTTIILPLASVFAQTNLLDEDFEDRNLSENPAWTGNLDHFIFYEKDENTLLRLNAPEPGTTQLRTRSDVAFGTWTLFFEQDFPPSNNNRALIYLLSDREDLSDSVNGYAIRTGENSSPNFIRLFRVTDGNLTEILTGGLDISQGGAYQVKLTRSGDGIWSLYESKGYQSSPLYVNSIQDNVHTSSNWFGMILSYTSSRKDGFYFDDISITDGIAPLSITDVNAVASRRLHVTFSQPVDPETAMNPDSYSITGGPLIKEVFLSAQNRVELTLAGPIHTGVHSIMTSGIQDMNGNMLDDSSFEFIVNNPFRVLEIFSISKTTLRIRFSDEVAEASESNFLVNGETEPAAAVLTEPDLTELQFEEPLPSGRITISIKDIESSSGWVLPGINEAELFIFDDYSDGDVIINEFMYRAPDHFRTSENDRPQYVELYNRSGKNLNLKGWILKRSISTEYRISDSDLLLEPEEYLVLTNDAHLFEEIYGERNFFEPAAFPRFLIGASSADEIKLFTMQGLPADSLRYTVSEWGGLNSSLERRSDTAPAYYPENWSESQNASLPGSPGRENDAVPDSLPPELVEIGLLTDQGFQLIFNTRVDVRSALNHRNYRINPVISISLVMVQNNLVNLFTDWDLTDGQFYEIYVERVKDIFGNEIEPVKRSVQFIELSDAQPQNLVINEILYRRAQTGAPEFIEIFNRTENSFDLSGWSFSAGSGSVLLPPGIVIKGGDYLVLTDSDILASEDDRILSMEAWPGLSNSGDDIVLRDVNGVVIDSLFYDPGWGDHIAGVSLERKDPGALSVDQANWQPSRHESGSTPASINSRFMIDITAPHIIFANQFHPDSVEIVFSEFVKPVNTGSPEMRFLVNGTAISSDQIHFTAGNHLKLYTGYIAENEDVYVVAESVSDFQGNLADVIHQPIARPAEKGTLVFNEIMYNPLADNHDGIPNQSEFIEIHNRSNHAVSLEGIFLHDEPDENGGIIRMDPVTTMYRWIEAGGYSLIYPEPVPVPLSRSRTGIFFGTDPGFDSSALRINRSTLSLTNNGRQVWLADSTGKVMDMIDYRPDWHNPNLISTIGIALERISPDLETNNPSNWGSSTAISGGTPGAVNTLWQSSGSEPEATGLVLKPNPFSPDADGFEDRLFINYRLNDPDYLLRVRVFDRYGRHIRTLADGLNAGLNGTLIWDGKTDTGQSNRIGIYIIYAEAYNSSNGSRKVLRETAVLARQF
jgi:hypothetical protein